MTVEVVSPEVDVVTLTEVDAVVTVGVLQKRCQFLSFRYEMVTYTVGGMMVVKKKEEQSARRELWVGLMMAVPVTDRAHFMSLELC